MRGVPGAVWIAIAVLSALAIAAWAGLTALPYIVEAALPNVSAGDAASVGIIGGADGPTAIFLSRSAGGSIGEALWWVFPFIPATSLIFSITRLRKRKPHQSP